MRRISLISFTLLWFCLSCVSTVFVDDLASEDIPDSSHDAGSSSLLNLADKSSKTWTARFDAYTHGPSAWPADVTPVIEFAA